MRRVLRILACTAALAVIGLPMSATALASGTGTSAGDQQYVDPLTTSTPTTTSTSTTQPTTSPSTTQAPSSTSSSTSTSSSSSPATTSTATTPTTTSSAGSTRTLPYTGLNIEACIAVGIGLLGAGLLLRRIVARA